MDVKPHYERLMVRREYTMVELLLRQLFKIPSDEMILSLEWDKKQGRLILISLKD